jgi:hypothetical protein
MQKLKAHIGYKISLAILIVALLVPSFVKLAHAFENHKHEVCKTPQKSHYHELDLDCEFYKFKLSNAFYFHFQEYVLEPSSLSTIITNFYKSSYSNFQVQQISLRGPPQLI